ncbi:TVP38/TMEM64 family protein [Hyalangium rubrum]|uniref:TVP38/TMEM64 family membrane protein n=1 Tax=Hyalangium rubrum TaxID=3103134 RepID=A0ABU5HG71_9BACT|nr:VTT domain-containing protein [Hyalangium sp. s54d21]MDY7231070.1 VTT domain-containing protein [Hyalangium sp. s54d21]
MAKAGRVKSWLRVLAPIATSICGLALLRLLGPDFVDQETLSGWLAPMGKAAPLAYILALAIRPFTLLPGTLFAAVGGMAFGTLAGTLYALVGSFLSGAAIFALARKLGARPLKRLAGEHYQALTHLASKHDFQFAFLCCINPLLPTDIMFATAAASGARFWPSVGGMMLGTLPGTFLMVQFGSGLAQGRTVMTIVSGVGLLLSLVLGGLLGRRVYRELHALPAPPPLSSQPEEPASPRGVGVTHKESLPAPS